MALPLVHHASVDRSLKFASTTVGRDKAYRAAQYMARFLAWYLARRGYDKTSVQKYNSLKSALGLSRKLMRIGKPVEHLQAASKAWNEKDEFLRVTAMGRQFSYAAYLFWDTFSWIHGVGAYKFASIKDINERAYKFWLAGITFSICNSLYKLRQIRLRLSRLEQCVRAQEKGAEDANTKEQIKAARREIEPITRQFILDFLDFTIPAFALGYLPIEDGYVGLAGLISSLMGARTQWKKVNG